LARAGEDVKDDSSNAATIVTRENVGEAKSRIKSNGSYRVIMLGHAVSDGT